MSLRGKIVAGFWVCVALLAFQCAVTVFFVSQLEAASADLEHAVAAERTGRQAMADLDGVAAEIAALDVDRDPARRVEAAAVQLAGATAGIASLVRLNDALDVPPETGKQLADAAAAARRGLAEVGKAVQSGDSGAARFAGARSVEDSVADLGSRLAALGADYRRRLDAALDRQRAVRDRPTWAAIGVFLLAAAALMVHGWVFAARLTAPVSRLAERLRSIADGHIHHEPLPVRGTDELARLGEYTNRMAHDLDAMIRQVADCTAELAAASKDMALAATDTGQGIRQQQAETTRVQQVAEEMATTMTDVARIASEAADGACAADAEARGGQAIVTESIEAITALASEVQRTAQVVNDLEQESNSIGTVLDVIRGIAEQTNLLALNAAIEAARAGEQGRGFAVVADEVRTLASRTQQSTEEIQEMIERLQAGTRKAVTAMEQGRLQAEGSVDKAGKAGESLGSITAAVSHINELNTRIAELADQQKSLSGDINENMNSVGGLMENATRGTERTAVAGDRLASLSSQLESLVRQFKF